MTSSPLTSLQDLGGGWVPTGNGEKDQDDGGMDGSRKGSKTSPASRAVPATHSVGGSRPITGNVIAMF